MPLLDWFLQEQERLNFQVFVISGESNRANPLNGIGGQHLLLFIITYYFIAYYLSVIIN